MSKSIAIIGGGGLGREIRALVERDREFAGFFDDRVLDEHYLGQIEEISTGFDRDLLLGIGDPVTKKHLANQLVAKGLTYANVVSKHTVVDPGFLKGSGIIICDGVIATVDCTIGSHVLLNLNVTLGHDVTIGDYSSVMPGANISGGVTIGEATLIGSGAVILQGISIGNNVKVGAGAVVTQDVPDYTTVIGIPARRM